MTKPFVIDTKKSLYKPIAVMVDGKEYKCRKLTRPIFLEITRFEKKALKGDIDSLFKQLNLLFPDIPKETIDVLDIREIQDLLTYVVSLIYNPDKDEVVAEVKNAKGPGENK